MAFKLSYRSNLHKGGGNSISKNRCSLTSAFLVCTSFIFTLVLGTQFKMMSILGNHDVAISSDDAGGRQHHHVKAVVKGGKTSTHNNMGKRFLESQRKDQYQNKVHHQLHQLVDEVDTNNDDEPADFIILDNASSSEEQQAKYKTMSISIAQKWNLTTPNAAELLYQQFMKVNDYNSTTDFFHFHHLYKSGGTSISNLMDRTIGLPKSPHGELYYEGILPGSYMSGNFDHEEALKDVNRRLSSGTKLEDLPYKASYAHTGLRPVYGPKRTKTGIFLLKHLPPNKRLRVITMLRDPTDFRASNHAMIGCGLNYEVTRFNNERIAKGLESICYPKDGLNISSLVDRKIHDLLEKCHNAEEMEAKGLQPKKKLFDAQRKQCKEEESGIDTLIHCRSAKDLLESKYYDKHYRSMFTGLMGRFHRGQEFNNNTAYGRMGYGFQSCEKSKGYSVEKVEEYTLQDLGGLDLTISGAGDGIGPPEPDFIWFGITERMKESTTLFYYYFKSEPLPRTPIHRIQDCRPTSWWTAEDREEVKRREPADYAVWRAANAILDVRMEKMKMEIQSLLDAGATKESLYYVDWDQLEQIGVKLENEQLVISS